MGRAEGDASAWDAAYAGWLATGSAEEAPQMPRSGKNSPPPRLVVMRTEEPSAEAPQMPREIIF